ncbi:MAG TPA: elongation factor G-like protein EF-G2 [Frankiaceae bacterium]|nr:elongation factor G-like protein EF-G2 [Frankiaceae bacterium]
MTGGPRRSGMSSSGRGAATSGNDAGAGGPRGAHRPGPGTNSLSPGQPPGSAPTVRNVVVVGHGGAGKTTLVECLLAGTGTIPRLGSVAAGTTVSDYDEAEHRQQRSVNLAVAPLITGGPLGPVKVNLIDTPGYADFVGDLRAGLRAGDAAMFVVSAVDGVDDATRLLWEECAAVAMPRAIVITKLDSPRADFEEALAVCQDAFGSGVLPLYLPLPRASETSPVPGLVGLLSGLVFDYTEGRRTERAAVGDEAALLDDSRSALIEGIIAESEDESLMDRYLAGEQIDVATLIDDLETAVARGSFYPVLAACATDGLGSAEILEVLTSGFPSPQEHVLPPLRRPDGGRAPELAVADPDAPLLAEVVKTTTDPYVGRMSLVRVFSGTLRPDQPVHVSGHGLGERGHQDHDVDEKIGALAQPLGKNLTPVSECVAGDICAVTKLAHAETGDTLSAKDSPLLLEAWEMPDPLLPLAIRASSKADEDKLSTGLNRLVAEDPTLRLELSVDTGQLILWCMGEAHADVLLDRLKTKFGVSVGTVELRVPLRETFLGPAKGMGRNVKQTGGHGQFAICHIEVEPLPSGTGFEFVDRIVGGVIPRQLIPSVEKGVRAQMERGVSAGFPVVDLRVTLVDGKAHSVDSSDMAFQVAGSLALKEAAKSAPVALLEPVLDLSVLVPDDYVGAVLSDLAARRGRVVGTEPIGTGGRTLVRAEVPEIEVTRYAIDLRSITHASGTFARHYLRHEPMPTSLAAKLAEVDV